MQVTIHKTKAAIKPISVDGVHSFNGVQVGKEFSVRDLKGQEVAKATSVRMMEFALYDYFKSIK